MKKITAFIAFSLFSVSLFCQELTAKKISDDAIAKKNPIDAIAYIKNQIENVSEPAEKRSLYAFLGNLQEMTSLYNDARESYAKAAGISAQDAEGMPKKSSERLVIDAVRCALCSGEGDLALQYLNSAVRNSKSTEIQAQIKLYEQWAILINVEDTSKLEEPLSILETYSNLESMKTVKQSVLLTLWYIKGEKRFAEQLVKEYPASLETAVVTGKAFVMPSPFWYFVPRKQGAEIISSSTSENTTSTASTATGEENGSSSKKDVFTERPLRQQLGLFKDETNANKFADRVRKKGFDSKIQSETRASGTTYYIVFVDENAEGTIGLQLKDAGFECYPLY